MFGRRVPPHLVLLFSVLLALACAVAAFFALRAESWVTGAIGLILAVWFAVDAVRAYGWQKAKEAQKK
ncbi:hypothetical protein [Deinococcus puniceus]|uniref:Uncharacterized protein n=1 Tax=Deinococcus puniceus TaxID=1182568 RepID=A0A172T6C3_9DEIO|nr:hypothetical protein [Deinococcus puniceus]ANE42589.1 hypothetical protein SU48_01100 [Deinococcus puniceus]